MDTGGGRLWRVGDADQRAADERGLARLGLEVGYRLGAERLEHRLYRALDELGRLPLRERELASARRAPGISALAPGRWSARSVR